MQDDQFLLIKVARDNIRHRQNAIDANAKRDTLASPGQLYCM